jgi:lysozyme
MKTSDAGIYALALHEGIVPAPYYDSVGVLTYGIGHTAAAGSPDPAKMPKGMPANLDAALREVFETFRRDLPKYEAGVNRAVKVPISQAQFDALVSFHYNTGAIGKASLVARLNAGDFAGAAAGFMAWKKPPEIIPRRKEEQKLFATGTYPGGQVTVWQVSNTGKVIWKPARRLNMPQVLDLLRGGVSPTVTLEPATPPLQRPTQRVEPVPAPAPAPKVNGPVALVVLAVLGAIAAAANWLLSWF